ncbi:MAG: Isopropylmalate/citramalate isomerase small subunit [Methanomassiliicoccales archaeon PtaB.Bin134]|jgi:3-isopropylmalate dehydratase small subunit|nr:MAG: Isopropylmalate/citramalate isomerase small subunit [Methanomassiliicoccales archaeon PtaB.Bin134]
MRDVKGRVWRFGDHVDTDQIIPAERLTSDNNDRLGTFAFEKVRPEMAKQVKRGDIIVAGRNFGCGSSREHAPRALLQMGISCVVAESYARIFYRNCINTGLLPVECQVEAEDGDELTVDFAKGVIRNVTRGREWSFAPFPRFVQELIDKGGLMAKIKEEKRCSK